MTAGFSLPAGGRVAQPSRERTAVARADVAAFIRSRPTLLDAFPTNPSGQRPGLAVATHLDHDRRRAGTAGRRRPRPPTWQPAAWSAKGAAVEYLTWRRQADLPDPAAVVADPRSVAWRSLDPSRTWAILAGVVGYSTGRGTVEAWREGWGPLAVAAELGKGDVAAACARDAAAGPPGQCSPARGGARVYVGVLTDAGLLSVG